MTLNLKETCVADAQVWAHWPGGGFDLLLRYLPRSQWKNLVKSCQVTRFENRQKVEELDLEKFRRRLSDLILNWREFTVGKARSLFLVKAEASDETEIPCNPENKRYLLEEAYGFDDWLVEAAKSLHEFKQAEEENELKN